MKNHKTIRNILILIIFISSLIVFRYFTSVNTRNAEKVKIGMGKNEVVKILGEPDRIVGSDAYLVPENSKVYCYGGTILYGDFINIVFDENGKVIDKFSDN